MMLQVQRPKEPNEVEKFTESKISQVDSIQLLTLTSISGTLNIYGTIMQSANLSFFAHIPLFQKEDQNDMYR